MSNIQGTSGDDVLVGTADADEMDGGAGRDRLNGGDGDDIVSGGDGNDYVYGDGGDDKLYGGAGNDALVGHSGNDEIYGGEGNDGVFAGGNDDRVYGENGNDTIFGDGGNDYIDGGEGDDRLFGGSGNDTLVYSAGQGSDEIAGNTGVDTIELILTAGDLEASRGEIADFAAWLEGELNNAGGEGAHAGLNSGSTFTFSSLDLEVSSVEDVRVIVDGQEVSIDELANQAPEVASAQTVSGMEDNVIAGAVGATDADGDELNCAVSVDPTNGVVQMDALTGEFTYTPNADFSGTDSFRVVISDGVNDPVEQVVTVNVDAEADAPTLTVATLTAEDQSIEGSDGADTLTGGSGDDVISGGAGNDRINGDQPSNGNGFDVPFEITAGLQDTDGSETLTVQVSGLPQDATLSAGTNQGNGTWVLAEEDLDGLRLSVTDPVDTTLTVTATTTETNGDTNSVSQSVALQFNGSVGGDDILQGGAGNDIIDGGAGNDTVDMSDSQGGVYVDLSGGFALGNGFDVINNVENAIGSDAGDLLVGSNGDNVLEGGAGGDAVYGLGGDDTFVAGSGNDSYYGGSGNDTADFSGSQSSVDVNLQNGRAEGDDTGRDRLYDIENAVGGAGNDQLTGSQGDNSLSGGDGNDTLQGGRGSDILTGGAGSDTFTFSKSDVVSGRNHHGVDRITDFGVGDRLDFDNLLRGVRYDDLSDVVRLTETSEGTMVSLDVRGAPGFTDVVFLEGVFDLDLDFLDGNGQIIV